MKRHLSAHFAALTTLALGCDAPEEPAAPEFRVEGGDLDDAANFPGVGKLSWRKPDGKNGACSGTLVGPRHVLTAAHCFDGISPAVDVVFDLAADTTTGDASLQFVHTAASSGPIQRPAFFAGKTFDETDSNHTARDVAIVILDRVVPADVARPHPVAGVNAAWCSFPDDGEAVGTLVGYGPTEVVVAGLDEPILVDRGKRNFMWAEGWRDSTSGDGRAARWINDFWGGGAQEGSNLPGDSGGPLFEGTPISSFEPPTVCGVISSYTWHPLGESRSIAAATHRGAGVEFLRSVLASVRLDCFRAEGSSDDVDGDRIADGGGCDLCIGVRDEEQRDGDRDGVGDLCDNCPTDFNPRQENAGTFGQRVADGRTLSDSLPTPATGPDFAADPTWASRYPGDVCNPAPLTTLEPVVGASQVASGRTMPQQVHAVCYGDSTERWVEAEAVANNVIVAESFVGGDLTQLGNTRVAVCSGCDADTATCLATQCGLTDNPASNATLVSYGWTPASLLDRNGARVTGTGVFTIGGGMMPTRHVGSRPKPLIGLPSADPMRPRPDVQELVWAYWEDLAEVLEAPEYGTRVVGQPLLWAWTRNYDPETRPDPLAAVTAAGQEHRRQSILRLQLEESFDTNHFEVCDEMLAGAIVDRGFAIPDLTHNCRDCPDRGTARLPDPGSVRGPEFADGFGRVRALAELVEPALLERLQDRGFAVVTAADHAPATIAGGSTDRAVLFDLADHRIVGMIHGDTGKLELRAADTAWGDRPPPTPLRPAASTAAAMSASRGEVAFFDAYAEDTDGVAIRRVRLRDGDEHTAALVDVTTFDSKVTGEVLAAAWRVQDEAYFVVVRREGTIALLRVTTDNAAAEVASFADGGSEMIVDLVASAEGLLTVTRRSPESWRTVTLAVDTETLAVQAIADVAGEGRLTVGVMPTAMGLVIDRADRLVSESLDFDHYPADEGAWQGLFQ